MSTFSQNEVSFKLNLSYRPLKYYCITGFIGILYVTLSTLFFVDVRNKFFYITLIVWNIYGLITVWLRWYFWQHRVTISQSIRKNEIARNFLNVMAGILWGSAGYFFLNKLSIDGQYFLIAVLIAQTFNGIPAFISVPKALVSVWFMLWLPAILIAENHYIKYYLITLSFISLFSALFIMLTLKAQIFELFQLKESSIERVDELDENNQRLKMFLLGANHDLSQPISSIQHSLYILKKHRESQLHVNKAVQTIDTATQTLKRLIKEIILSEEITSGIAKPEIQPVFLMDVFDRVISSTESLAKQKGINLYARPTQLVAETDPYIIERVITNLVDNALKYTLHGKVLIAARRRGKSISIEVWDTGVGIKSEDQEFVFKAFKRLKETSETQVGYGLGLSIVKRLTESIHTDITLRSEYSKGSVFKFLVPLYEENMVAADVLVDESLGQYNSIEGLNIALVDDDSILLNSISDVLRSEGAIVSSATTTIELLTACRFESTKFDVIITDWNLQLCSGEAAYQQIAKELSIQPKWIIISGDISDVKERELLIRNIPVIRKPFSPDLLLRELEKLRNKREFAATA